jgi:hypothetical protein
MSKLILLTIPLLTAHAAALEWTETPTEVPTGILYSVDSSAGATWTVGAALEGPYDDFRTLALRWDGARWNQTRQPVPDGRLFDVAVRAAHDVWAVGERSVDTGSGLMPKPMIQQWNGRSWTIHPVDLPDADQGSLTAVATTGRTTWAAGWGFSEQSGFRTLVYRHDGTGWRPVAGGAATLGFPNAVLPLADDNVWVAGFSTIGHFDGRRWKRADLPGDDSKIVVMGLAATGPNDVWAAGLREDPVLWRRPLVLHYDGVRWTEVSTPAESAQLNAIEVVDGRPIAVGEGDRGLTPYVLQRVTDAAGSRFERTAGPPRAAGLLKVTSGSGRIWVVGTSERTDRTEPYVAVATSSGTP